MTVEYQLARLTAQSKGANPKEPGGGIPTMTREDIAALASEAPHMAWHALMAKYCDDAISEKRLLQHIHLLNIDEWFTNPKYATTKAAPMQLNKLAELAVLGWVNPQCPHAKAVETRAAFIGAARETYRRVFQDHYAYLLGELGHLEQLGITAFYRSKKHG